MTWDDAPWWVRAYLIVTVLVAAVWAGLAMGEVRRRVTLGLRRRNVMTDERPKVDAHEAMGPVGVREYDVAETPEPVEEDTGAHALEVAPGVAVACRSCGGRGWIMRTVSDLLGDSVAVIKKDDKDSILKEFYRRLLAADEKKARADRLAPLFPPDLLTTDEIDHQRDRLWAAVEALATTYRPGDRESMGRLNTALDSFARHHALFWRPEGPPRGATKEEYAVVGSLFMGVLREYAGAAWLDEWDDAWGEAYEYAADQMHAAAQRARASGDVTTPRYPRGMRS